MIFQVTTNTNSFQAGQIKTYQIQKLTAQMCSGEVLENNCHGKFKNLNINQKFCELAFSNFSDKTMMWTIHTPLTFSPLHTSLQSSVCISYPLSDTLSTFLLVFRQRTHIRGERPIIKTPTLCVLTSSVGVGWVYFGLDVIRRHFLRVS